MVGLSNGNAPSALESAASAVRGAETGAVSDARRAVKV